MCVRLQAHPPARQESVPCLYHDALFPLGWYLCNKSNLQGELKEGGGGGGEGKKTEVCEFNYASIVFTVQRFFGNI